MVEKTLGLIGLGLVLASALIGAEETLPPLQDGKAPTTVEEAWAGFDPRKESLDTEILEEWEEDGVVVKVLRFRVGVFKGKKAMMAAVYGYPKGAKNLPALVQIHGGGQSAQSSFVVKDAKNGYATISIAWAGRIKATNYLVTNKEKEAFWTGDTDHPDYRVTTDWGAVDAYHHHCRFKGNNFVLNPPSESTIDPVKSPRNSGWFLAALGARRAITFLERQSQVNKDRIGVYGMSMGGKLTVLTAGSDSRIKAAAPACGGISDLSTNGRTLSALADDSYLKKINCPTIFLTPSNDFHSKVQDIPQAVHAVKNHDWRVVSSPNKNHGDSSEYSVGTVLWFNHFLKGEGKLANTPKTQLALRTADHIPTCTVTPDPSQKIKSVEVYYTEGGKKDPKEKYWRRAKRVTKTGAMTFQLPVASVANPLWVYADVEYALGRTVEGVGYSGEKVETDTYHLASVVEMRTSAELKKAGVQATLDESVVKEDFNDYQVGHNLKKAFPILDFKTGISCVADPGSRQGMSIRITDSPDYQYPWQPLLTLSTARAPFVSTSRWMLSADVMLDAKKPVPLIIEFRTKDPKKRFTPIIVNEKGQISSRGNRSIPLCDVKPGSWWNVSVAYDVNHPAYYQVTIKNAKGTVLATKEIENPEGMGAVNWMGFIPHGTTDGNLYVDNLTLQKLKAQKGRDKAKTPAPKKQISPTVVNAAYGAHKKELMNLWLIDSDKPKGILLDIHGGGWMGGKKAETMHKNHLHPGYHYASISYPLVNEGALQPAMLNSALRAVQFLRHKANEWNIDSTRIVVTGGSAGGCSSLLVALHDDVENATSKDPIERMSSRVAGAAVAGAQTTMNPFVIKERIGEKTFENPMPYKPFGAASAEALINNWSQYKDLVLKCSPVSHVSAGDPPLHLFYNVNREFPTQSGGNGIHSPIFGEIMVEACKKQGVTCYLQYWEKNRPKPALSRQQFLNQLLLKK